MDRLGPGLIVVAVLAALLALMWWAWRRRVRRDSALTAPALPEDYATDTTVAVLYVATTQSGKPFERLAIRGLQFRARAELSIAPAGLALVIPGQEPVFLAAASITDVGSATVAIDRVVESDGLVRISWSIDGTPCDTYVRIVDTEQNPVVAGIRRLIAPRPSARTESETPS